MTRTRVVTDEHDLGRGRHAVRAPDPRLRALLYRDYVGFEQESASFGSWLEAPRPALTVMVDVRGTLRADGAPLPDAWLGGLSDRPTLVQFAPPYESLDVELTPLGAYTVLGRPLHELQGTCVRLDDLFGAAGGELAERLREATSWDARFDLFEAFLTRRALDGPRPSPVVAAAVARLRASGGRARIEAVAAELGCSRRHLTAAFRAQVGLAPKTFARLVRFERLRRLLERDPIRWADVAYECGYSDQPHLNREFRELAGTTPTDFLARILPGFGGVVGDGLPFVQDAR